MQRGPFSFGRMTGGKNLWIACWMIPPLTQALQDRWMVCARGEPASFQVSRPIPRSLRHPRRRKTRSRRLGPSPGHLRFPTWRCFGTAAQGLDGLSPSPSVRVKVPREASTAMRFGASFLTPRLGFASA